MTYIVTDKDGRQFEVDADDTQKAKRKVCKIKDVSPADPEHGLKSLKAERKCHCCKQATKGTVMVEVRGEAFALCRKCKKMHEKARKATLYIMIRKKRLLGANPAQAHV